MTRYIVIAALALLIFRPDPAAAQLADRGQPPGFRAFVSSQIDTRQMGRVSVSALLAEDSAEAAEGLPYRFGTPFDVTLSQQNSGTWETVPDGSRLWRLRLVSPGAYSINLLFDRFHLPPGARLYIYNEDRSQVIGAFTSRNNKPHGRFATAPVSGDISILEYIEPAAVAGQAELSISRVVHAYRDVFSHDDFKDVTQFGDSGPCNVNINCPEASGWEKQARSVAMIVTSGGTRLCTGALINNVRQDLTPYLLTADHCLGASGSENDWIFLFGYESPDCSDTDGPLDISLTGSTLIANNLASDFALLLIDESPPQDYGLYYAGWDVSGVPVDSAVCIHHPRGDIKKFSLERHPLTVSTYEGDPGSGLTHLRVEDWDVGTTEGGSSGAPLFDPSGRIVGQLHGGDAACTNDLPDWFGRTAISWNEVPLDSRRLRPWLDPDNTGVLSLNGREQIPVRIFHTPLTDTRDTLKDYQVVCTIETDLNPLDFDRLKLHYDVGGGFISTPLLSSGSADEYTADIPAQSAGTIVDYFLTATDTDNNADTTEMYSFEVIAYGVAILPTRSEKVGAVGGTVVHRFAVENSGVFDDSYSLSLSVSVWEAQLTDSAAGLPITDPIALTGGDSAVVFVSVTVGESLFGDADSLWLTAQSSTGSGASDSAQAVTGSAGEPLTVPFFDDFDAGSIDPGRWVYVSGAGISASALNEPSAPFSLNLNGAPGGADTLISQAIDLSALDGAAVSYSWERGGSADPPETGDDLYVEYFSQTGQWQLLAKHPGLGPVMEEFDRELVFLPADALHVGFRLRFRNTGAPGSGFDNWYVDDILVEVNIPPDIDIVPKAWQVAVPRGQVTAEQFMVFNLGEETLEFDATVHYSLGANPARDGQSTASVEEDPVAEYTAAESAGISPHKSAPDLRTGISPDKNAGGPDAFGYFWIDSDEPTGPEFVWSDISATGTDLIDLLGDDETIGPYDLGFEFPFYGGLYSQIWISSNGLVGFDPANLHTWYNSILPTTATPNNIIAWFWDDLNPLDAANPGAHLYFDTIGGHCVVQWTDYPRLGSEAGATITGQTVLEPDGRIHFRYYEIGEAFPVDRSTIGIEDAGGEDGLQIAFNAPDYVHDSLAILIDAPVQWLELEPTAGTVPGYQSLPLTATIHTAGLDEGDYSAEIVFVDNDPDEAVVRIPVQLTVIPESGYICGDCNGDLEGAPAPGGM
jgi:hypothetical protein